MVYNKATKSYVEKELFEQAMKEDKIDPNFNKRQKKRTWVLSKN